MATSKRVLPNIQNLIVFLAGDRHFWGKMIKKIKVAQLRPGMFVHDFACGWLENPFFRKSLLIKDGAMIEKIIAHGIKDLFIDTAKGHDVDEAAADGETVAEEMPDEIEIPGSTVITAGAFEERIARAAPRELRDELPDALKLRDAMETALEGVFGDVSSGKDINLSVTRDVSEKMVESIYRNEAALPCIAKVRQSANYLVSRALNVASLMISFAKHLGLPPAEIADIAVGALLHDAGMLKVDQGLLKKQEKLTQKEHDEIKMHVLYSYEIVSKAAGVTQTALDMALLHHERYDGSGYSQGVKGEKVPMAVRMLSIADIFDAMTTMRAYSGGMNLSAANRKLLEMGTLKLVDEILVQRFIRCIGIYPVGTIVRLSSGKMGIVVKQNADNLLTPVVKVIYDGGKGCFVRPRCLDLAAPPEERKNEKIVSNDWERTLKVNPLDFLLV